MRKAASLFFQILQQVLLGGADHATTTLTFTETFAYLVDSQSFNWRIISGGSQYTENIQYPHAVGKFVIMHECQPKLTAVRQGQVIH